jgi:hypothetical protein
MHMIPLHLQPGCLRHRVMKSGSFCMFAPPLPQFFLRALDSCLNTRSSIHRLLSAKMLEVGHGKGPKDPNDGPQPQKAHRARKRSTDEGGGAGGNEAGRVGFVQTGRGQDGEDKASADEV